MSHVQSRKGYTFVELAIGISITIILATVSVFVSGNVLRQNRLTNQLRLLKSTVLTARAKAIEQTAPVRVTVDPTNGGLLVLLDRNRDGDFTDPEVQVVIGGIDVDGNPVPQKTNFANIEPFSLGTSAVPAGLESLTHWTGVGTPGNFPNNEFIIMPNGTVLDTTNFIPTSGAFFFKTGKDDTAGAVFISARGEVRTAFTAETGTNGVWNDWVWHR